MNADEIKQAKFTVADVVGGEPCPGYSDDRIVGLANDCNLPDEFSVQDIIDSKIHISEKVWVIAHRLTDSQVERWGRYFVDAVVVRLDKAGKMTEALECVRRSPITKRDIARIIHELCKADGSDTVLDWVWTFLDCALNETEGNEA